MSEDNIIDVLRHATINKEGLDFFIVSSDGEKPTESIKEATHVKLGKREKLVSLDEITQFYNEDKPQTLRAVIFCWLHEKSSIVDYKNECIKNGIPDFKFLVKTELTTWLSGNSDTCSFVKRDEGSSGISQGHKPGGAAPDKPSSKKRKLEDPQIERISRYERESVNHNVVLRGSKNIEFSYLISDAKRFISQLKRSKTSSRSNGHIGNRGPQKQPIIIISPASTSLISLTNIKEFLEDGRFVEPSKSTNKKPENGIVIINHNSDKLVQSAQLIMVVDNVDLFTKPEYWDRVIAIFTTGQAWQFAKYKYSKPELLFQRYPGFFVNYLNDITPRQIKDWNVTELKVDRGERRFRDKLVVRDFWSQIEKVLIARGYGK